MAWIWRFRRIRWTVRIRNRKGTASITVATVNVSGRSTTSGDNNQLSFPRHSILKMRLDRHRVMRTNGAAVLHYCLTSATIDSSSPPPFEWVAWWGALSLHDDIAIQRCLTMCADRLQFWASFVRIAWLPLLVHELAFGAGLMKKHARAYATYSLHLEPQRQPSLHLAKVPCAQGGMGVGRSLQGRPSKWREQVPVKFSSATWRPT